jgi:hypothetical protein
MTERKLVVMKDKAIVVKCSEKENIRIHELADKSNMTVSSFLREIATEGRYPRRTRDKKLIGGLVGITQLCNEISDYPEIQEKLQREIDEIWQIL